MMVNEKSETERQSCELNIIILHDEEHRIFIRPEKDVF